MDYYTLGHFSKFVLPGSTAVWSSNAPGLISAAFVTPNHNLASSPTTTHPPTRRFRHLGGSVPFRYTLPALAGATFTWTRTTSIRSERRAETTAAKPGRPRLPRYTIAAAQQIQASSYTQLANLQSEPCADADGGFDIGCSADGGWLEYDNIDFGSGRSAVDVRWASAGSGGTLEFHLDSTSRPVVAQAALTPTGGWQAWQTFPIPLSGAQGLHKLFIVSRGGTNGLGNLNWFRFR